MGLSGYYLAQPHKQPDDPDLDFADGELDDTDPKVIEGLRRLAQLRATEGDLPDFPSADVREAR